MAHYLFTGRMQLTKFQAQVAMQIKHLSLYLNCICTIQSLKSAADTAPRQGKPV